MGYPTKVQLIKRKASEQWYINFPSAVAQAMEFARGEVVEWIIEDKGLLALRRTNVPPSALKKNRRWTPRPLRLDLGVRCRRQAAASPRTGTNPRAERARVPGTADGDGAVVDVGEPVRGLVCRVPNLRQGTIRCACGA